MTIAIIAAMEQECAILAAKIQHKSTTCLAGVSLVQGKLEGREVALVQSGIGKVSAALGTALLLEKIKPQAVINTGSAGRLDPHLRLGDVVISTEVAHHDVNLRVFGYQWGQLPKQPARFRADQHLIACAEQAVKTLQNNARTGLVISGDQFIHSHNDLMQLKQHFADAIACEMEAAAVAQVCSSFGVPFVIVRAISDGADGDAALTFDEFLPLAAQQSSQLVQEMLKNI